MGSAPGTIPEPVEVAYTRKHYPHPFPPKFCFRDLYKNTPLHDERDLADEDFDWLTLDMALRAEDKQNSEKKSKYNDEKKNKRNEETNYKHNDRRDFQFKKSDVSTRNNHILSRKRHAEQESKTKEDGQVPEHYNDQKTAEENPMVFNSRRKVDEHAKSGRISELETFDSLFRYLKIPIKHGFYPDTFFVRALIVWLGYQNMDKGKYEMATLDTPAGVLENIKCGSLTYTKAFALLSRMAGIPCVLIDGFAKAGTYEPGDTLDTTTADTWCAVLVDGSWQLLHPVWVVNGIYGEQIKGHALIDTHETLPLNQPSHLPQPKERKVIFNEEYFMPPPEEFINKCWTDKLEWQLLPNNQVIRSLGNFYDTVYITPLFLKFGLSFTRKLQSNLHTTYGTVRVEIDAPTNMASRLLFHCVLIPIYDQENEEIKPIDTTDYTKFVFGFRSNERYVVDVSVPYEGKYRLEISGGIEKIYMLCRFLVICTEPADDCDPLPVDTGIVGWGPGPKAERSGLILPSNPSGLLSVLPTEDRVVPPSFAKPENITHVSFQLGRKALLKYDYSVDLRAAFHLAATNKVITKDMDKNDRKYTEAKAATYLSRCVEGSVDHVNRLLRVKVTVPREGEYALVIKTTDYIMKKEKKIPVKNSTKPICFYLLLAREDWAKQYTPEKLARRELHSALSEGSIERLQTAVAKCKSVKIPVIDNEIAAAELRIEYMKIKRDLQDSIKRRNDVVLNDTLKRVIKYRYRSAFVDEVEQLLLFKNELLKLQGYPRGIYSLKDANEEVVNITHPLPEVHNTMKALLLMLGYYGNMDDWQTIQSTIRLAPNTLYFTNILKQMQELEHPKFPWRLVKRKHIQKVEALLHRYPYQKVFKASQAAALFYKWVERCISMVPRKRTVTESEHRRESATSKQYSSRRGKQRGRD